MIRCEGREVVLCLAAVVTDTDATHFVIGSRNYGVMTVDEDQALGRSWVPGRLCESTHRVTTSSTTRGV